MKLSFAPLEGIADYTFRNAHKRIFGGADDYYTPFIAANPSCSLKEKEKREVAPGLNPGISLVPQILANRAYAFVSTAQRLAALGYREVNLNLGCPSPSVTAHGRGAGLLRDQDRLDRFLWELFEELERAGREGAVPAVSVKTRSGFADRSETEGLVRILNRYPFSLVIVHPRLRTQLYAGSADWESFAVFYGNCEKKPAYNGDIRSPEDAGRLMARFPGTEQIMIGRGAVANPALFRMLKGGRPPGTEEMSAFHDELLSARMAEIPLFEKAAGKMKELWFYWSGLFEEPEPYIRRIRKACTEEDYRAAVEALFGECTLKGDAG